MSGITRRRFLRQSALASAGIAFPGIVTAPKSRLVRRKFNVLFLMSDDMRVELGCYDSRFHAKTPNLDTLAKSGVRFDRNYCQFPLCNPSRSSLLTGRPPTKTGVLGNRTPFRELHPDWITLPQLFKENGYLCVRHGKIFHPGSDDPKAWHEAEGVPAEGEASGGAAGGKDLVVPSVPSPAKPADAVPALPQDLSRAAYSDRIVVLDGNGEGNGDYHTADRTVENLRQYKNQPFFLACGFVKPHSPPAAPKRFFDLYDVNNISLTPDFAPWPTVPPGFPKAAIRPRNADLFINRTASVAEAKEMIRAYIASISWVDWNVGRVLAELDRLGLRQKTIIVFVADHGYQLGEKGKWSKAGSLFEMGTRVPTVIAVPGAKGNGHSCYRIVESLDIYSTLAELCGLALPSGVEGKSLVPLLNNPVAAWDKAAYSVWSEDGKTLHGVAVRTEKWRYAEFGAGGGNGAMLFDPGTDPSEMTNLADVPQYAKVRAELSALTGNYAANLSPAGDGLSIHTNTETKKNSAARC
jgi:iduronate 2-sulfatase